MKERKKRKREKISRKSLAILIVIVITVPLLFVGVVSFDPYPTGDNTTYISASDILKNFKFESIGEEPIVDEGAFNNKLRFDTQASWLLYQDDVIALNCIEDNDTTYLKYRIVLRNKINMYTNVKLSQMTLNMRELDEPFLGVKYRHNKLGGSTHYTWEQYINWECYDFGDIRYYNEMNNIFSGRITMSFDIDDNPIPDTFGSYADKNFDHIAVSEAGIITNTWGKMSDDMPEIIELSPSEEESEMRDDYTDTGQGDNEYNEILDPYITLEVIEDPIESFDGGIQGDTAGSSLDPTNKDGTDTWDPETEEKSMTGCKIHYDLVKLSPVIYKWGGKLSWKQIDLETEDYIEWFSIVVKTNHRYTHQFTEYRDVALHGINRYIQTDMYVAFDIWTSVTLGTLTDYYENMKLEAPTEYYDALIWSTLAGGWTGSRVQEYGQDFLSLDDLFDWFGGLEGLIMIVILIAVVGIGGYVFLVVGVPALKTRQMRKQYETMDRSRQMRKQYEDIDRRR